MSNERPSWDQYWSAIAKAVATRGTCPRRKVGSVLTTFDNRILSTGYNGKASGLVNCIDQNCEGAKYPSGQGLDKCEALHAEQNALLLCSDVRLIHTCYVTTSPCISCVKMLMGTGCMRIVFTTEYPHTESRDLWLNSKPGREWVFQQ